MEKLPGSVYSVGQLNAYIRNMFEQDYLLTSIYVQGEISNLKYHSSGHIYFTLKDAKGTIACVMFASARSGLKFQMEEGMQVIVGGSVTIYERDGKYQLYAKRILISGNGQLYERFEQLKKELEEMGLFAPEYKRAIPKFIKTLGVVTADTGAAVRDIINIATRRNPYVQIILYPAIVQGENAPDSIVRGIRALERAGVDVMIVGRGGGSIEDLWAFNERKVAQAVFDCSVPIISAVGHETDTTICDYVADLRAPTPSAAAELAVYDVNLFYTQLSERKVRLTNLMAHRIERERSKHAGLTVKLKYLSPMNQLREKKMATLRLEEQLTRCMKEILTSKRHRLQMMIERMKGLSPLEQLNHGLGYVSFTDRKPVLDIEKVKPGDTILVEMKNGEMKAQVTEVNKVVRDYGEQ